jgi:hypothetical protein
MRDAERFDHVLDGGVARAGMAECPLSQRRRQEVVQLCIKSELRDDHE